MASLTRSIGLGCMIGLSAGTVGSLSYLHFRDPVENCMTPDTFIGTLTEAERNWQQVGTITGIPMQLNTPIPEPEFNRQISSLTCRIDTSRPAVVAVLDDMHRVLVQQHHRITIFLSSNPAAEATLRPRLRALEQQIEIIGRCIRQPAPSPNSNCTEVRNRCRTLLANCNDTNALVSECTRQVSDCRTMRTQISQTIAATQGQTTPQAERIRAEAQRIERTIPNCTRIAGECERARLSAQEDCTQIRQTCETTLRSCPELDQ